MSDRFWLYGGGGPLRAITVEEFLEASASVVGTRGVAQAYAAVPWVYRCVQLRVAAIGGLPFKIYNSAGDEIDWPVAPALSPILHRIEFALCLYGASYLLKLRRGRQLTGLQWLNPATVTVKRDARAGLVGFEQTAGGATTSYRADDIVYHRTLHPQDDLGPGIAPAAVAMHAARLVSNTAEYMARFFEQGAIPAVLLTTEQQLSQSDIEQVKSWWERTFGGVKRAWRTGILGRGLKPQVIGSPLKDMVPADLLANMRQQIAVAFGVPQTLLEDAANYATAREHRLSFYYETVFPEADLIASELNQQLFAPLGLEFAFDYGAVEAVQQDEATKAQAIVQLYQMGIISRNEAREQLGLPVEQPPAAEPSAEEGAIEPEPVTPEAAKDLARWRRKAERGDTAFESEVIPGWVRRAVAARLASMSPAEAIAPFTRAYRRETAEAKLQKRMAKAFEDHIDDIAREVAEGAMPELEGLNKDLYGIILSALTDATINALMARASDVGIGVDYDKVVTDASAWAREYAGQLIKQIDDTQRQHVREVVAQVANGEIDGAQAKELLAPMFGDVRAQTIAVTELTRAESQAHEMYVAELNERGVEINERWLTAEDEKVCDICGPLDHTLRDVWQAAVGGPPPAHPNCRCQVVIEHA